ncbi:hypothetical protein ACIU0H_05145 [Pseudomonas aeruginosa]|uniref:hypothetical protein n=1 Tax=Pseudomonas aeruginosa TaxID=287 RepID=UPI003839D8DE
MRVESSISTTIAREKLERARSIMHLFSAAISSAQFGERERVGAMHVLAIVDEDMEIADQIIKEIVA